MVYLTASLITALSVSRTVAAAAILGPYDRLIEKDSVSPANSNANIIEREPDSSLFGRADCEGVLTLVDLRNDDYSVSHLYCLAPKECRNVVPKPLGKVSTVFVSSGVEELRCTFFAVSCEKFPGRKTVDSAKNAAGAIGKVLGLPALAVREEQCSGDRTALWMIDKSNRKNHEGACLAVDECHNIRAELHGKDIRAGLATDVDESRCEFFIQHNCPADAKWEERQTFTTLRKTLFEPLEWMSAPFASVSCTVFKTPETVSRREADEKPPQEGSISPALSARQWDCTGKNTYLQVAEDGNSSNHESVCLAPEKCYNLLPRLLNKTVKTNIMTAEEDSWCIFYA
ncbi:hypothetical protein H2199_003358 [Coniosporium tulheliwenetii]|nr:hypothetical protein H2199_003358 [Cladosporium sp. JES 115]